MIWHEIAHKASYAMKHQKNIFKKIFISFIYFFRIKQFNEFINICYHLAFNKDL